MENLETRIKAFLSTTFGDCCGYGYGDSDGKGYDKGYGFGRGYGCVDGYVNGMGYGSCDGSGSGFGFGSDDGSGSGSGEFDRPIFSIKELNGNKVYIVDGVLTIIKSVHENIAQGFIVYSDLTLQPCYIVKEQNRFAHGETLHDAFTALQEKLYDGSTEEDRIEAFLQKFPNYDTPYPNRDLFAYHHVLTGSCRMGRENFCKNNGINLDDSTTVREFIRLTKNSYGFRTIRKLPLAYGVDEVAE